jgi:hypothetical protein
LRRVRTELAQRRSGNALWILEEGGEQVLGVENRGVGVCGEALRGEDRLLSLFGKSFELHVDNIIVNLAINVKTLALAEDLLWATPFTLSASLLRAIRGTLGVAAVAGPEERECIMSESVARRGAVKLSLVTFVVTVAVAVPTAVWASHQFNDVPDSHPFHDEISAIAGAGITTGFPDGGFHPGSDVTRQAMAAFMERGLGRVGYASPQTVSVVPNAVTPLAGVVMDAGATGAGGGFVYLIGTAEFSTPAPGDCPCRVQLEIADLDTDSVLGSQVNIAIPDAADEGEIARVAGTVQTVVPMSGDATRRFGIRAYLFDSSTSVSANATVVAQYVPFGPTGSDTLCAADNEPNDVFQEAQPYAAPLNGCLSTVNDKDVFAITIPDGYNITAETMGLGGPGTCDTNTFVGILLGNGSLFSYDDDDGAGTCSLRTVFGMPAGTYYVQVWDPSESVTGPYRLTITTAPVD